MITKLSVLKRMITKKVFVITDIEKCEGYIGTVNDVKDETNLVIRSNDTTTIESIFNIRSIPYEF